MNNAIPASSQAATPAPAAQQPRRFAATFKLLFVGTLALLLLIPLSMVKSLLSERRARRTEAITDITGTWGDSQTLTGPVLVIPYRVPVKTKREQLVEGRYKQVEEITWSTAHACFLPTNVEIVGTLDPSVLHRGIYAAVVYRGALAVTGTFAPPDFSEWKIDPTNILWEDASILVAVSSPRGISDALALRLDGATLPLSPGPTLASFANPLRARVPARALESGKPTAFALDLKLNGSGGLNIAPVGMQTRVTLDSPWPNPSFQGAFLPAQRDVSPTGFKAVWQVSYYGRSFPQAWTDADGVNAAAGLARSAFGVSLVTPVDNYRLVERALKYGILFVVLLFTGFFLFETLARLRIHPLQYLLIGAALCIFYLSLLALSELFPFGGAYLAAAGAATALVAGYSASVLGSRLRAALIGLELTVIYGFLFITLQLQDYALVFGSAGLFAALAIVMFTTRRVNWYEAR
jgi:inner membrane protein